MRPKSYICLLLTAFLFCRSEAANRYWVGSIFTNWNNILNWSATSGGLGGASIPGTGDAVIFDNGGTGSCNIDVTVSVASFTVNTGYRIRFPPFVNLRYQLRRILGSK